MTLRRILLFRDPLRRRDCKRTAPRVPQLLLRRSRVDEADTEVLDLVVVAMNRRTRQEVCPTEATESKASWEYCRESVHPYCILPHVFAQQTAISLRLRKRSAGLPRVGDEMQAEELHCPVAALGQREMRSCFSRDTEQSSLRPLLLHFELRSFRFNCALGPPR